MGEFITNIFNAFLELMRQFRAVDVLDIVVVAFAQKMDAADKGAKRDKGQSDNLADRKGRKLKDGRELTQLGEMRDHTLQVAPHGKDCRDNSIGQQKAK